MSSNEVNVATDSSSVASRKLAAAELRKARKAARDPRNRLFSDTSDEVPKGILKNARPIPTKRSVSECVNDLSQIMEHLNLNIDDLPKNTGKFCPRHCDRLRFNRKYGSSQECFDEEDENTSAEGGDEEEDCEDSDSVEKDHTTNRTLDRKECDCNINWGDDDDDNSKPKKSVRFNDHVYETVFFASRLYDRRYFAKYHFSSRHHPPGNTAGNNNKSKKNNNKNSNASKSENKDEQTSESANTKSDSNKNCKLSKSQRAKQSKKDKKKRLNKREEVTDMSSDDQGYCSSLHSFSD